MKRPKGARPSKTPSRPPPTSWLARDAAPAPDAAAERLRGGIAIAVIGLVAAALVVFVAGPHKVGDYFTETDFYGAYSHGARAIERGHVDPSRYGVVGPVYEVILALFGFAIRDLFVAAELISVLSVAMTLALWFAIARRLVDGRVALAALVLMAANPYLFRYGYAATTDALSLALLSGALAALLLGRGPGWAFGAGLLGGISFLTRYNLVVLLPAGVAIALAGGTHHERRGRAALLVAAGFLAPVVPWILWSLGHGGRFSFQLHHNIAYEVFAHARGITWDEYQRDLQPQFHSIWDVIARDPGAVAARLLANAAGHLRQSAASLIGWPVAMAALAGIALGARDGSLRRLWPVWLTCALLYLTLVPAFYSERYALVLLPAFALLGGIAFGSAQFAFAIGRGRGPWLKTLALAGVLTASVLASVKLQARTLDQLPVEVLDAARVLRPLAAPGDRVIARKGHIAYHAGVEALPFPFDTSLAGLGAYAHRHHARWLYFSWPEAETRPRFFHLLDTTGVVPGLVPRASTAPHPAVLYEIGPDFGRTPEWYANDSLRAWHTLRGRLAVNANDPEVLFNLALLMRARGELEQARSYAQRAAMFRPADPEPVVLAGVVGLDLGDPEGAGRAFQHALQLDPSNVRARLGLGWSYAERDQANAAAAAWREVVDKAGDIATLARMIEVFEASGDAASAARARARLAALGMRR